MAIGPFGGPDLYVVVEAALGGWLRGYVGPGSPLRLWPRPRVGALVKCLCLNAEHACDADRPGGYRSGRGGGGAGGIFRIGVGETAGLDVWGRILVPA